MITGRVGRILFGLPDRRYTVFTLRPERGEAADTAATRTFDSADTGAAGHGVGLSCTRALLLAV